MMHGREIHVSRNWKTRDFPELEEWIVGVALSPVQDIHRGGVPDRFSAFAFFFLRNLVSRWYQLFLKGRSSKD
ncbi:hypothetical protein PVAP13_1NG038208 [Panicum virgatum]|uniref:Uncharacterized protein n=1 Tax=Panicum virgatum TaxID=38727 RepID=A0A8T0WJY6_PANVG|nr:hypothetical protein PVAP13_1NG038208 [Panicum virgatum]